VAQKSVSDAEQIAIGQFRSQNARNFVQRARKGALGLNVANTGKFIVKGAEFVPFISASDPDKCREIETSVIADIFIVGLHRRVDEEVCDALVDRRAVFQSGDKGPNVLEGSASHDFGARVEQETIVEPLEALGVAIHWSHLRDLGDDVSARFSYLPLFVLGQVVIEREKLLGEGIH